MRSIWISGSPARKPAIAAVIKVPEMPLYKRIWQCPCCGVEHDCDINAALNIQCKGTTELQAVGLVVSAHGGQRKSVISTVAA